MLRALGLYFGLIARTVHSRRKLLLKNLALRQQLAVLAKKRPQPRLSGPEKLFWVMLRRFWPCRSSKLPPYQISATSSPLELWNAPNVEAIP